MSTSTALAVTVNSMDDLRSIATMLAMSNYFDAKGNSETAISQIATKILAGQEIGYGPFASVNGIHVIQGKPSISGNLMAAAIKSSGRYDYRVRQMEEASVSVEFFERIGDKRESLGVSTFTKEDAQKAGTQNMAKYPRNMLFNRAISNGVRWYCPDVFNGNAVYVPEELGATVNGEGEIIETTYTTVTEVTGTQKAPVAQNGPKNARQIMEGYVEAEQNGNGKEPTAESAKRGFHAVGVKVFGDEWNTARPWLLKRYTTKNTPDSVREHTSDMTVKELTGLRSDMDRYADHLRNEWTKENPPIDQPLDVSDVTAEEGAALFA